MIVVSVGVLIIGILLFFWDALAAGIKMFLLWAAGEIPRLRTIPHKLRQEIKKRRTLKAKVRIMEEGEQGNLLSDSYGSMVQTLSMTGGSRMVKLMRLICIGTAMLGIIIALSLRSWMLAPILGIGFGLIPMWLTRFRRYRYQLDMIRELSVVLSMVTNSYIRNENIIKSVEENEAYMTGPVADVFHRFVHHCRNIDPNIKGNLLQLAKQLDNSTFTLWCQLVALCQDDINQKYSLNAIVEQFAQDKELYNALASEISQPVRIFLVLIAMTMCAFPLAAVIGNSFESANALSLLFTTFTGQLIVVGYAVTVLFGLNRAIDLSTNID